MKTRNSQRVLPAKKFMEKMKFLARIDEEYIDYHKYIMAMSKEQLVTFIQEFAAIQKIYEYLKSNVEIDAESLEFLSQFENPLSILHDAWMNSEWDYLSEAMPNIFQKIQSGDTDLSSYELQ